MSTSRASISGGSSYQEIGKYWDEHDLSEVWDQTKAVDIEVSIRSQRHLYPLEQSLSQRIMEIARNKGVSPETLVNLWIQERVERE
jgi:hypothetical protein